MTSFIGIASADHLDTINYWNSRVELAFSERSLRQLCENGAKADRHFGLKIARKLRRRLADLQAANCINDLVAGRPRAEGIDRFTVEICNGFRITLCANHSSIPKLKSGEVDWRKVSRVKLLKIEGSDD